MSVFGNYARYYDLLYRDKDYAGEAAYVAGLLRRHAPAARSVLELGCGTGRHAELLSGAGYRIMGIDRSAEMLTRARERSDAAGTGLEFAQGDICALDLGRRFDAALSLFHVVSYQVDNDALRGLFAGVRDHLVAGGVFVFDAWYGPAVLTDRPAVRVLRLADERIEVTRVAEPVMHAARNVVDVNYEILIRDKAGGGVEQVCESHAMRYLFEPEIELLLAEAGMELAASEEWLTGKAPGFDTWGVCFVARVRAE